MNYFYLNISENFTQRHLAPNQTNLVLFCCNCKNIYVIIKQMIKLFLSLLDNFIVRSR